MKVNAQTVSKTGLIFFIIFNLIGSSAFLNNFPKETVTDTLLGKSDHFVILVSYLFALLFITLRGHITIQYQNPLIWFFIPNVFLLLNWYVLEFVQFFIFTISINFFAKYSQPRMNIGLLVLFITILILIVDTILNHSEFMLTTYYGRPRLLLGFFHPKEAAIAVFVAYITISLRIKKFENVIFFFITFYLLFIIDSRNVLLSFILFNLSRFLVKYVMSPKFLFFSFFISIMLAMGVLYSIASQYLDSLSSSRLEMWRSLTPSLFGPSEGVGIYRNISQISAVRIDSFYLDFLMGNGWLPFLFLLTTLFLVGFGIARKSALLNDSIPISIFISLCTFAVNDSGMFSTGNLLHVFGWFMIVSRIIKPQER